VDELACSGAGDFRASNSTVGKPTNFVDVGVDVLLCFGPFDEVTVFQGGATIWVDDGIDEVLAVWVDSVVLAGMVAGWLSLGGAVPSLGVGGVSVAAGPSGLFLSGLSVGWWLSDLLRGW
jgi:hypothetical protein